MGLTWNGSERDDPAYRACLTASTAGGAMVGTLVGGASLNPLGVVAGGVSGLAVGFVAGYLVCPYLAPRIRDKVRLGRPMSDFEVRQAAEAMGRYAGVDRAGDALLLVALIRDQQARRRLTPRA